MQIVEENAFNNNGYFRHFKVYPLFFQKERKISVQTQEI